MKYYKIIFIFVVALILFASKSESKANINESIVCDLEDVIYGEESGNYLRFFNQSGNIVEFIGLMPHDVHGKMKIVGNKLTTAF